MLQAKVQDVVGRSHVKFAMHQRIEARPTGPEPFGHRLDVQPFVRDVFHHVVADGGPHLLVRQTCDGHGLVLFLPRGHPIGYLLGDDLPASRPVCLLGRRLLGCRFLGCGRRFGRRLLGRRLLQRGRRFDDLGAWAILRVPVVRLLRLGGQRRLLVALLLAEQTGESRGNRFEEGRLLFSDFFHVVRGVDC